MFRNTSLGYDHDLFIFLPEFRIHIATGGAKLPVYMLNLTINNFLIYSHFEQEHLYNFEIERNKKLEEIVYAPERLLNESFESDEYTRTFDKFAKQGFFSFDKTNISDPYNKSFHLVSFPTDRKNSIPKDNQFSDLRENKVLLDRNGILIDQIIEEINTLKFDPKPLYY
ncbi:hypothetical protein [Flavobacterium johnsoniae]|uniref:Uncharacterized protein n=1 Tax=Flavobacterium johnsoniae (strain ATCC 17061 / DSM 2064 / JCM 8514 / BCRC 14874 / CCUG 350202 / NBRC 14942 / NCIMB 11054 / UW101) TaxID=376686 RepID=A5FDV0_FLAJ1|nr:hypothetical protein [Flavobacterium johnsoniae]ABQ06618.1 hypothetical protein Fjoh_3604 [Flavobacterium johnsoniae UW101]OXE99855.1 hypothetical protein B0A63_11170 [Flavobacterium johnsoniae UW101]WQG82369.1 hypothetical protein SR927_04465 [Flavobacterium johnsoniae UW101]SHK81441.1 hypothetical protein SAMN05444146_2360 [Flavobacterium johnsoniae]